MLNSADITNNLVPAPLKNTYKSLTFILGHIFTVVCGAFYFGYTLAYLSTLPFSSIQTIFHINI